MYKFPIFLFSPVFRLAGNTARCLLHCARSMFRCALGRPDACKAGMDLAHDSMSTIACHRNWGRILFRMTVSDQFSL